MEFTNIQLPISPGPATTTPKIHITSYHYIPSAPCLKSLILSNAHPSLSRLLFLDASLILHPAQLRLSTLKSCEREEEGGKRGKKKTVGAEVVWNLWWKKNLKDAFGKFGIGEGLPTSLSLALSSPLHLRYPFSPPPCARPNVGIVPNRSLRHTHVHT